MPNYSIGTLIRNLSAAQQSQSLNTSAKAYPRQISSFWESILCCFGISKHYAEQDFVKEQGVKLLKQSVQYSDKISDLRPNAPCENYKESARLSVEGDKGETFWVKLREISNSDGTNKVQVVSDTAGRPDYGTVIHTEKNLTFFNITHAPD